VQLKNSYHKMVRLYINMKYTVSILYTVVMRVYVIALLCLCPYISAFCLFYTAAHVANEVVYTTNPLYMSNV